MYVHSGDDATDLRGKDRGILASEGSVRAGPEIELTTSPETGRILSIHLPNSMTAICKHPIVKVVAREEDAEFVECQRCGEVFDSAEFSDIAIEEEHGLAVPPVDD